MFKAGQRVRIKFVSGCKDLRVGQEHIVAFIHPDQFCDYPIELKGQFEHVAPSEIELVRGKQ